MGSHRLYITPPVYPIVHLQAEAGPDEEGGLSEAQGAGGEKQERSTHGGGSKKGGQPVRELPAREGKAYAWLVGTVRSLLQRLHFLSHTDEP